MGAIDEALLANVPLRAIADQRSVSKSALIRHRDAHIPVELAAAKTATAVAHGDALLAQLHGQLELAKAIVDQAEEKGDLRTAIAALREVRSTIEASAKLTDALWDRPQANILITAEWLAMRAAIVKALEPYPVARHAVVDLILDSKEASELLTSA